ncbi:hypothetical protein BABINDRAFT_160778 [Babjeviella inositovora NRRL Y-12698]|uniref:N(6)-L-threonylcarbamoyladenine synthase n=1 Tax=Babjeviella inositovora NRRL Y-12698 TaxID=984486 RepID=A0A1E3QSM1_9ASCO|nr:uncharacterized protein BABINDRAFT_160778 [Babjeviella inositovora NRRL Y-12698]ODQ80504.1 hypothetical protein BABINDRAFT_160778 [Babjeviella inositovora NRRL Y-12698]
MLRRVLSGRALPRPEHVLSRTRRYRVLAIESSCDDACIALLQRDKDATTVITHQKSTLDSSKDGGLIPKEVFIHHTANLPPLLRKVVQEFDLHNNPPDLVVATRGPGMSGSLTVGVTSAKGLAIAWNKPFLGVHHMLGHLLVPRLNFPGMSPEEIPQFPMLSLLVSGGHTFLVLSRSLSEHQILCDTIDIAIGDSLDKCAREIGIRGVMIGKEMDAFVNERPEDWNLHKLSSEYIDMEMPLPLKNFAKRKDVQLFSFSPFVSGVRKALETKVYRKDVSKEESMKLIANLSPSFRRNMAYQIQEAHINHLCDKLALVVRMNPDLLVGVQNFVLSGGVGANSRLRERVQKVFPQFRFHFPKLELCTDNAVMIGWCGIEIFETLKVESNLNVLPLRRWPLVDLLTVDGWMPIKNEATDVSP